MDLQDQLKNLFPDHQEPEPQQESTKEDSLCLQDDPIICKYEKRKGKPITILEGYNGATEDFKKLAKEALVGLVNGLFLAIVIYGIAYVFGNPALGLVVSLSLLTVIFFAAIFGTLIPLLLDKWKIDPALATGPFVTTLNDVLGLFIYFTIGILILGI